MGELGVGDRVKDKQDTLGVTQSPTRVRVPDTSLPPQIDFYLFMYRCSESCGEKPGLTWRLFVLRLSHKRLYQGRNEFQTAPRSVQDPGDPLGKSDGTVNGDVGPRIIDPGNDTQND